MLHCKVVNVDLHGTHVKMFGEITEATTFSEVSMLRGRVVLDLSGVRRINSYGVRELLAFFDRMQAHCTFDAERCAPAVVAQLNMLPMLSKRLTVRSVLAPMECEKCLREGESLVEIHKGSHEVHVPSMPCPDCEGDMLLSEPEDRYFAFLEG